MPAGIAQPLFVSEASAYLTRGQSVEWLNARGAQISVRTLDRLRKEGKVAFHHAPHGKVKITYAPADLAVLLPERCETCPSSPSNDPALRAGSRAARTVAARSKKRPASKSKGALDQLRTLARSKSAAPSRDA